MGRRDFDWAFHDRPLYHGVFGRIGRRRPPREAARAGAGAGTIPMAIFKKLKGGGDLRVSMAGLRLGDKVLQIGSGDPRLIALLARQVGAGGQASALVPDDDDAASIGRAARAQGALVDVKVAPLRTPPFAQGWFDLVVIPDLIGAMRPHERVGTLQGARQVLRVGGRCLVVEAAPRGGLGALFSGRALDPHYRSQGGAEPALRAEGFKPVRTLAERQGMLFTEGMKPDPGDAPAAAGGAG